MFFVLSVFDVLLCVGWHGLPMASLLMPPSPLSGLPKSGFRSDLLHSNGSHFPMFLMGTQLVAHTRAVRVLEPPFEGSLKKESFEGSFMEKADPCSTFGRSSDLSGVQCLTSKICFCTVPGRIRPGPQWTGHCHNCLFGSGFCLKSSVSSGSEAKFGQPRFISRRT